MAVGSEIAVRMAVAEDAPDVARLIRAMLGEMAALGGRSVREDESEWAGFMIQIAKDIGHGEHLFLLAGQVGAAGEPIGLAQASLQGREGIFEPARVVHVSALYVDPDHRRRGIGRTLLQAALDWGRAQGCTEAGLNVLVGNTARKMYEAMGFHAFQTEMVRGL